MKKITVVIPNFNGMQYVERCLDSLERQTFSDFDVIFVDNGSVDGSRELTEEKYPWVKVIALAENTGFCKAVNLGIEATQTPYVVLLNNDTEAEPDFLKELYLGIERKKNAFPGQRGCCSFMTGERWMTPGIIITALAGHLLWEKENRKKII